MVEAPEAVGYVTLDKPEVPVQVMSMSRNAV